MNIGFRNAATVSLTVMLFMVITATPALPQAAVGTLAGRAMDASGALIPGVEVGVDSNVLTASRSAITNESGGYRFISLTPGTYTVTFSLPGFATLILDDVRVQAGITITLDGRLQVASVAETITVTGSSPAIDLESAQVQTNFDDRLLEDIPTGRTLRALMGNVPGFYARAIDVGGSGTGTGTVGSFRAFGDAGQSYFLTDGVYTGGHYSDLGAYSEIQIVAAGKGADVPNPGVYFNAVIRSGTNEVHGYFYSDYENDTFQQSNLTSEHAAQGVKNRKFSRYHSHNGEIGGPIIKDKVWYYFSHYDVYNGEPVAGLTDEQGNKVDYYTRLADPTYKFTFQITDNNKLETMGQFGWKHQPYRSGNQYRPAEAARDQASWSMLGKISWQSILSPTATLDMQFSRWGYWWPSFANKRDIPLVRDLTTGYTRGSLSENYSKPTRWQWNTTLSYFTDAGQGNHELKVGWGGWYYHFQNEIFGYATHQQYDYRSAGNEGDPTAGWPEAFKFFVNPNRVTVDQTPFRYDSVGTSHNFYINDRWNIVPGFTFNWGIRFDRYDSHYPDQGNKGLGPYATKFDIKRRDFAAFNNFVPRLSFVWDLTGDGTVAFKMGFGRYYGDIGRDPANRVNPGSSGGAVKRYCAVGNCPAGVPAEAAWDGTIPYTPDERAVISTSSARVRAVDPNLKNNYLDEVTAGIDFTLGSDYSGRITVVRKWDRDGRQTLNSMLPYSAYTDSIARTFEGNQYVLWSVPKSYAGYGKREDYLTNYPGAGHNSYLGWTTDINKRLSDGYQFMISFGQDYRQERCVSHSFSVFSGFNCSGGMPDNPNEALHDASLKEWEWVFKGNFIYELPRGFMFSGTYKAQSGQHYGRQVRLKDRNNSTVAFMIDRDKYRMNTLNLLDLRISKTFALNDSHELEAIFDVFNVVNSSAVTALNLRAGSSFQRPSQIVPGRIVRLGAKWVF